MSRSDEQTQIRSTGDPRDGNAGGHLPSIKGASLSKFTRRFVFRHVLLHQTALQSTNDMGNIRLELHRIQGDVKRKSSGKDIHDNDVEYVLEDQKPYCIFVFQFEKAGQGSIGEYHLQLSCQHYLTISSTSHSKPSRKASPQRASQTRATSRF
jgi:hypothetical protein